MSQPVARGVSLRRIAGAAVLCALGIGGVSACSREIKAATWPPVPTTLQLRQASSTTIGPDFSNTPLPATESINVAPSTIGFARGRVTMTGVVQGPDGPVEGAIVRIERLVDDQIATMDTVSDAKGVYRLTKIQAGRVRIRAFRPPDLVGLEPIVVFASGAFQQPLQVKRFDETSIQWSLAPSEPKVNEAANIVVQVSRQDVGTDGILRQVPVPAVGVTVTPLGLLQTDLVQEALTNERGRVQVTLRCLGVGGSDLQIALATGESATISPPGCQPVTTTTTATIPPSTVPVPVVTSAPPPVTVATPPPETVPVVPVVPDPNAVVPVPQPATPVTPVAPPTVAPAPVITTAPVPVPVVPAPVPVGTPA
jgi:hypothetical protein